MTIRLSPRNLRTPLVIVVVLLFLGGAVLAAVMMFGGSGSEAGADPSPKDTKDSPSADAIPKAFCEDLSLLSMSATMYAAGVGDLVDTEHDNGTTMAELDRAAGNVADYGALVSPEAPADIKDEVSTVVESVAEAHKHMKDDKLAAAFAMLYEDKAVDARDAVTEYDGPDGECE